jgi:acetyltransferase/esterase
VRREDKYKKQTIRDYERLRRQLLSAMASFYDSKPTTSQQLKVPNAILNYELYPSTPSPSKPLLLLIHGGNGGLDYWRPVATSTDLSSHVNICIYDRRGFSRSPLTGPQDYVGYPRIYTDADDASALIKHLSPDGSGIILGNSSGAVVALTVLERHAGVVRTCIAHEAPLTTLLPDYEVWLRKQKEIYDVYRAQGHIAAMAHFNTMVQAHNDRGWATGADPTENPFYAGNILYWFEREFQDLQNHQFDLEKLARVREKLVLVNGEETATDSPQYRCNVEMGRQLGLEVRMFASGHIPHQADPPRFAIDVVNCLRDRNEL